MALIVSASVAIVAADGPPPCVPLPVAVHVEPWRATLSWPARATPSPYFVEYRAGKFPTQLDAATSSSTAEVEIVNLAPGRTYVVEVCEPRVSGGCPADEPGRACTTRVTVAVPLAYAGVTVTDEQRAVCTSASGLSYDLAEIGGPAMPAIVTPSAQACCEACAATEPHLPYADACRAFRYDERTHSCALGSGSRGSRPADGVVSGRVVAWPRGDGARDRP